ncbi:hypothetical protein P879_08851 [Paragonimus westermani]|uniref:Phospholipase B-like n=1 Tax=Paragonimus westermani TaxID=34504 RepID=A0A8T0D2S8_9TREM|nr:hypothetical protein P879_08851 [Paragonimus westermani]
MHRQCAVRLRMLLLPIVLSVLCSPVGCEELSQALIFVYNERGVDHFRYMEFKSLNQDKLSVPIVSIAIHDNQIEKNGWTTLSLMTSDVVPDKYQAYWAGFLETNITYELTNASFENSVAGDMVYTISSDVHLLTLGLCPEPLTSQCKKLKAYLSENMEYVIMQYLNLGENDEFWYQVGLQMWQLKGMSDAYRHIFVSDASTLTDDYLLSLKDDVLGVYLLQLSGDLSEILKALALPELINQVNQFGVPTVSSPSCSALIKLIKGDVYLSHVTWSPYSMMLRVLKHYNFPWKVNGKDNKKIPGYAVTFSSYPSVISSIDDFYITSAKLVSHEYKLLLHEAMWSWIRSPDRSSFTSFGVFVDIL